MKVAAIQMNSQRDVGANFDQASQLIAQASDQGAELIVLPENFSYLGARDADRVVAAEQMGRGDAQSFLAEQARTHGIWLVGGTIPIWDGEQRTRQRSLLLNPDGDVLTYYDKLHLFDVTIPGNEAESYSESAKSSPGNSPVVAATAIGRIAMSVCYDLRFPALFHRLGVIGMDIVVVPAAFTVPTGRVHWQALLQTRAFESLVFVVASGQWGQHSGGRLTYGHSAIVGPWGQILAIRASGVGIAIADVDLDSLAELRTKFPVLEHRREF